MADPLGFINASSRDRGLTGPGSLAGGGTFRTGTQAQSGVAGSASFKDVLKAGVEDVNRAQQEATRAVTDIADGQRPDLEGIVNAANKADNAFRMLQQLRNKMVEAYDEIKQMRV